MAEPSPWGRPAAVGMTPLSPTRDPFAHRIQLFTGKGGVGKSTLVASLAVEAVRRGYRPLVVELGHRASMEAVFGEGPIEYRPRQLAPGVSAMNLELQGALMDYMTEHIRFEGVARFVLDNKPLQRFFYAAPGVAEVATLNKLRALEAQQDAGGNPAYHPIFVDLDATGHALMLLELPRVLDGLVGAGPLRKLLLSVADLLADPDKVILNLVTLPTELPVQETIELYERLEREHRVQLGRLYVNQVPSEPLSYLGISVMDEVAAAAQRARDFELLDDVALGRSALRRYGRVLEAVERLRQEIKLPMVQLPRLTTGELSVADLRHMGRLAVEGQR